MQPAALDPHTGLLMSPISRLEGLHLRQLADALDASAVARPINSARAPHNNIRAEMDGSDAGCRRAVMKAFAKIESGYNPKATTGKYKACYSFPTGSLPNTGMATSTRYVTARSRRPERLT